MPPIFLRCCSSHKASEPLLPLCSTGIVVVFFKYSRLSHNVPGEGAQRGAEALQTCPLLIRHISVLLGRTNSNFLLKSPLAVRSISLGIFLGSLGYSYAPVTVLCFISVFNIQTKVPGPLNKVNWNKWWTTPCDSYLCPHQLYCLPSPFTWAQSTGMRHSNPLCDNCFRESWQVGTVPSGVRHCQKCWKQRLKVTVISEPTAGRYVFFLKMLKRTTVDILVPVKSGLTIIMWREMKSSAYRCMKSFFFFLFLFVLKCFNDNYERRINLRQQYSKADMERNLGCSVQTQLVNIWICTDFKCGINVVKSIYEKCNHINRWWKNN